VERLARVRIKTTALGVAVAAVVGAALVARDGAGHASQPKRLRFRIVRG
jgi:hypothetical protein